MKTSAIRTRVVGGRADASAARAGARSSPQLQVRRTAVLVAALFAFIWQSVLTQTHEHPQPSAVSALQIAKIAAGAQAALGQPSRDDPANCPICQEIAQAGAYIAPTPPVALHATAAIAPSPVPLPSLALAVSERSHAWRSRAPPSHLQA